jgi:ArsR family transcriptional regulator
MAKKHTEYANVFKALGDSNRLMVIEMIADGELCACRILEKLNITQPTLSHHMKILCDSGLVEGRKEGKWMHYSLVKKRVEELKDLLCFAAKDIDTCSCVANTAYKKAKKDVWNDI